MIDNECSLKEGEENMTEKKESSGWLMSIIIGLIVAVLLIIVVYPNFLGKKNREQQKESYPHTEIVDNYVYFTFNL